MRGAPPLPEASYRFRRQLLELLDRHTPSERFAYVDGDNCACVCPICGAALAVRFAGTAPRADLECLRDRPCSEEDVLAALGGRLAA